MTLNFEPTSVRNAGSASAWRRNAERPEAGTSWINVATTSGGANAPRCNSRYHCKKRVSPSRGPITALARIVRVRSTFVFNLEFSALPRSVAVESNALRFACSVLERHSAARKAEMARPSTRMSPPIRAVLACPGRRSPAPDLGRCEVSEAPLSSGAPSSVGGCAAAGMLERCSGRIPGLRPPRKRLVGLWDAAVDGVSSLRRRAPP